MLAWAALIWAVTPLGDQAFEAHVAGGAEKIRADLAALERTDKDAFGAACQQSFEAGLAQVQWQFPQIVATFGQDVEGAQLDFLVVPARMQRVEIGNAVNA